MSPLMIGLAAALALAGGAQAETEVLAKCVSTATAGSLQLQGRSRPMPVPNPDRALTITRDGAVVTVVLEGEVPYLSTAVKVSATDVFGVVYRIMDRPQSEAFILPPERAGISGMIHMVQAGDKPGDIRSFEFEQCSVARHDPVPIQASPPPIGVQ